MADFPGILLCLRSHLRRTQIRDLLKSLPFFYHARFEGISQPGVHLHFRPRHGQERETPKAQHTKRYLNYNLKNRLRSD